MKNLLLILLLCLSRTASFAQYTGLEGTWIGENDEFMHIADSSKPDSAFTGSGLSTSAYSADTSTRMAGGPKVFCKGDTLSFLIWDDELKPSKQCDLRIIQQTDTTLVLQPDSELSMRLFKGQDTLRFKRYKRVLDPSFKFEKIVFMVESSIAGPGGGEYHQVDSAKWLKYYTFEGFLGDNTDTGSYYVGQIRDSLYKELLLAIQDANPEKLQMSQEMCCDGPVSTLIIYYNGKRKAFETMHWPPTMAAGLFRILHALRYTWYKKIAKFQLER